MFEDERKEFILRIMGSFFNIEYTKEDKKIIVADEPYLIEFLDDINTKVLFCSFNDGKLILHKKLPIVDHSAVGFFKISNEPINNVNIHQNILITSLFGSPLRTTYYFLKRMHFHSLKDQPIHLNSSGTPVDDPMSCQLAVELEKRLKFVLISHSKIESPSSKNDFRDILTLQDEANFWKLSENPNTSLIGNVMEQLATKYLNLSLGFDFKTLEELLEDTYNTLDDIWRLEDFEFPAGRMENIFYVIGMDLVAAVQIKLKYINLWTSDFRITGERLNGAINVCSKWVQYLKDLTTVYWPNCKQNVWRQGEFTSNYVNGFLNRLKEIYKIIYSHELLKSLFSVEEQHKIALYKFFSVFNVLSPIQYCEVTEPLWRNTVEKYETKLSSVDDKAAMKLKSLLQLSTPNIHQLLQDFLKYKELLERPKIREALASERKSLLDKIIDSISSFDPLKGSNGGATTKMSKYVNDLIRTHLIENEIDLMLKVRYLLNDLEGYNNYLYLLESTKEDIHNLQKELYGTWQSQTLSLIRSKGFGIRHGEEVVVYNKQRKHLKINCSERLVYLIKETKQLKVLGYHIDESIVEAAKDAEKYMNNAKALMKIASFHNTIGLRIIVSQRGMLLKTAKKFSKVVQSQNAIKWHDNKEVELYIKKLQMVVNMFATENHQLTLYHHKILKIVSGLLEYDLYTQTSIWHSELTKIRDIVNKVEQEFTNTKEWRNHIDRQIYKIADGQYQKILHNVSSYLTLNVEPFIRNRKINCYPLLNALRKEYLLKLKGLLMFPKFIPFFGEKNIHISLIEHHAQRIYKIFQRANLSFARLEMLIYYLKIWGAIATVDQDRYISVLITSSQGYEANLKRIKYTAQTITQAPKAPFKFECFFITIAPFCDHLEEIYSQCWMKLVTSLRNLIDEQITFYKNFIEQGMIIVNQRPESIEDYINLYASHQQLILENEKMSSFIKKTADYHSVLKRWTGETLPQAEKINLLWLNYQTALSHFNSVFGKKAESLQKKLSYEQQKLIDNIKDFAITWKTFKDEDENALLNVNFEATETRLILVEDKNQELKAIKQKVSILNDSFSKLGMKPPTFDEINIVENEIELHQNIWLTLNNFIKELKILTDNDWVTMRKNVYKAIETFTHTWNEKMMGHFPLSIKEKINSVLNQLQGLLPYFKYLSGDTFSEKHWAEMFSIFGKAHKPSKEITFGDILFSIEDVEGKIVELKELNNRASAEVVLQQALNEVDVWEVEAKFATVLHTDTNGSTIMLIKDYKSVIDKVGDNQSLIQSVKTSSFSSMLHDRISLWEKKLTDLDQYLRSLMQIQQKWVYLEPILGRGSLEKARFERLTKEFKYISSQLMKYDYKISSLLRITNIGRNLDSVHNQLEKCQTSLLNFLEEKRLKFPRFYFISDNDLLEILSQPTKKDVLQSHLKKIFPGVHSVTFCENIITSIFSSLGEEVKLVRSVTVSDVIEDWLDVLAKEIKFTLKDLLSQYLNNPDDPLKYPSQVLCLYAQIKFTSSCESAIKNKSLNSFRMDIMKRYNNYTSQIIKLSRSDLNGSELLSYKLKSLLMDLIYHLDILNTLIEKNVVSLTDWNWEKCLRFYSINNDVLIRIANAEFSYTFEYQGNLSKLVHTSLTDNCYLTLTQALKVGFGGNPYGPAGTGKTESVKALGSLLGRTVLIFNCDEGLDAHSLTRIMIGLVKCGAWGCFDEFNRLDERTLSLISSQISDIQGALHHRKKTVMLLNKEVEVDLNSGIFITLNPAGKGYGGRQKLPENLKMLFRPVVMSKPDNVDIARAILHCEGFKQAEKISFKLVQLFEMASNTLSQQRHYDWGLRTLKTILSSCGHSLKEYTKGNEIVAEEMEFTLVVQAVRLNTLCKLTFADGEQFLELVKDIFIDVEPTSIGSDNLKEALSEIFIDLKLNFSERQVQKCLELFELMKQRMGVVVVGPASSGKSTIISLLKQALIKLGTSVRHYTINPKSVSRQELLGYIDLDTRQWNDGILTHIAEKVCQEPEDVMCLIHCDGDVDPEWIESLNSVLDDNHLLTLPSGWRILFGENVHFIFETHELIHASPATISRMGIIFLNEEDLTVKMIVDGWLNTQQTNAIVKQCIEDYFYDVVSWISQHGAFITFVPIISLVKNCLNLMKNNSTKAQFAISLINGLGSNLIEASKREFCTMVLSITEESLVHYNESIDYYYDEQSDSVKYYEMGSKLNVGAFELIQIPSIKVAMDFLTYCIEEQLPVIIIGATCCGKSLLVEECLKNMNNIEFKSIECNGQISPLSVIQSLQQTCLVVSSCIGRLYKPRNAEKLVIHLSDINLSHTDRWGSRMLVEFLNQLTTKKGFYDENLEWIGIENVNFIYTVTSLENVSVRFLSANHIFYLRSPTISEMNYIFAHSLKELFPDIHIHEDISSLMVNVFHHVNSKFCCSGLVHNFNLRDLSRWCKNLLRYKFLNRQELSEALLNEARRIFKDKLLDQVDQQNYENFLESTVGNINGLYYSNADGFLYVCNKTEDINVTLIKTNIDQWKVNIQKCLTSYEADSVYEYPILTKDLLYLVAKIENILTEPGSCVLLGGRVGIGRKTAVKIISKRQNVPIYLPRIGKKYSEKNFKNEMKNIMQITGINGEQCYFFIEDFQLMEECIYDMLNCVISTGEIPGLFSAEELNALTGSLSSIDSDNLFDVPVAQYFKQRVKENFHLILSFDIDNKLFLKRIKKCPSIHKNCYLIYLRNMSDEAMAMIPSVLFSRLDNVNIENHEDKKYSDAITAAVVKIHKKTDKMLSVSPLSYYTFIKTYLRIKKLKEDTLFIRQKQLRAGISKIMETQHIVEVLKQEAHEQEILLQEKQTKSKLVLEQIGSTMADATEKKYEMEDLRSKTEEKNTMLQIRKQEIDQELTKIKPLLQEARAEVGNIKQESISEIRSLRAPTTVIRNILEAVLRLMGIRDTSWNSMKTFLAKRGVREELRQFDASQITIEDRKAVENLLISNEDSFDPKKAARASLAAAPLAAWVIANVRYSLVLEKIQPLIKEKNQLINNIEEANSSIQQFKVGLQDVGITVQNLQEFLRITTKEGTEIELNLIEVQNRITAAEGLVKKLDEEFKIWTMEENAIRRELQDLWISCILAACFITYLPSEKEKVRSEALKQWIELLGSNQEFVMSTFLSSEREILQWNHEGLPSDEFSIQNGIITLYSTSPLLLDPLSTAVSWLLNHLKKQEISTISCHNVNFLTQLELAVRFGKTVILEVSESIPCAIMSIIQENFIFQGSRKMIYIGEKLVDFNPNFKLLMVSHDFVNKNFLENLFPFPVIDFSTSKNGLMEQLLNLALKILKPSLEQQRLKFIEQEENLTLKWHQMQEEVLETLVNTQGDILQNQKLLKSLEETKSSSEELKKILADSTLLKQDFNKEREFYSILAEFGAHLCFACTKLSYINNMYQMSPTTFKKLFEASLQDSQILDSIKLKCLSMLTEVYHYVCRSLFKDDTLTFAIHLVHVMFPYRFEYNEWEVFIGKLLTDSIEEKLSERNELPLWIKEDRLPHVLYLKNFLPELFHKLNLDDYQLWSDFMENKDPQPPKHCHLSLFQTVLVTQALRPDKLYETLVNFTLKTSGIKNIFPPSLKLNDLFLETVACEPILIISSPGNDPSKDIISLAAANGNIKLHEISAGPGCEGLILNILHETSRNGEWLILKNLHLLLYWLPFFERELQLIQPHAKFRIWITTEPHEKFPPGFLNLCLKITYEAPPGIKRSMEKIYDNWSLEKQLCVNIDASKVVFLLAWLHSVLLERRTYIPQGWTSFYEFNSSDLACAKNIINRIFSADISNIFKLDYLKGLLEIFIYGGRISNSYDLRVLSTYLNHFFNRWVNQTDFEVASGIKVPNSTDIKEHMKVIRRIPEIDNPEDLGLPKNANKIWQREAILNVLKHLKALDKDKCLNKVSSIKQQYSALFPIINLWKKLIQENNLINEDCESKILLKNYEVPICLFFVLELKFSKKIINLIHKSILSLENCLENELFNDDSIALMADSIKSQQIPAMWYNLWSGPPSPLIYLQSVVSKAENIKNIYSKWENENIVFDLSQMYNIERFLASLKQQAARFLNEALENLSLHTSIGSASASILEGSVIISGLLLEGATVFNNQLVENREESPSASLMPEIVLSWRKTEVDDSGDFQKLSSVSIPLYLTDRREKFITNLLIPCPKHDKEKWVLAGTAFYIKS